MKRTISCFYKYHISGESKKERTHSTVNRIKIKFRFFIRPSLCKTQRWTHSGPFSDCRVPSCGNPQRFRMQTYETGHACRMHEREKEKKALDTRGDYSRLRQWRIRAQIRRGRCNETSGRMLDLSSPLSPFSSLFRFPIRKCFGCYIN